MILKGQKEQVERVVKVSKRGDKDEISNIEFYIKVKALSFSQQQKLSQEMSVEGVNDVDLVNRYAVGWDLKDADEKEIPFTESTVAAVMDDRDYRQGIVSTMLEALFGSKVDFNVKN